jgi:Fe-S-cluster containining protein
MPPERYPDCENCEAPCCRRQFVEDDDGWYTLNDARPIYLEAGTDIKIVGWHQQKDGRQPQFECQAFDKKQLQCMVYDSRPEHCRTYDCRDDDPDEWQARAHCDLARHRRMTALRAKATV